MPRVTRPGQGHGFEFAMAGRTSHPGTTFDASLETTPEKPYFAILAVVNGKR